MTRHLTHCDRPISQLISHHANAGTHLFPLIAEKRHYCWYTDTMPHTLWPWPRCRVLDCHTSPALTHFYYKTHCYWNVPSTYFYLPCAVRIDYQYSYHFIAPLLYHRIVCGIIPIQCAVGLLTSSLRCQYQNNHLTPLAARKYRP